MIISKERQGQTLIETAIMLFLLLLILLGLTEFARAWYTKSSLKNAVRNGARIAAITLSSNPCDPSTSFCPTLNTNIPPVPPPSATFVNCSGSACPAATVNNADIRNSVCCSPGVRNNNSTQVSLTFTDDDSNGNLSAGDAVYVSANTTFGFIMGGAPWPWPSTITITTSASMRHE